MGMLLQRYLHPEKEVNTGVEESVSADIEAVEVEETDSTDKPKGKKAVKDDGDTGAEESASADS